MQTDPRLFEDYELAYSPVQIEPEEDGRRTPLFPHAEGEEEGGAETTFSPIPVVGEGLDDSQRAALESVRRVLTPDHRGDHEDEADAIAESGRRSNSRERIILRCSDPRPPSFLLAPAVS